jgi:hypothetical protein
VQASRRSPAKKPTKTYERPGLSEEEIEEIREAFNLFDTDGSGMVLPLANLFSRGFRQCAHPRFEFPLGFIMGLCSYVVSHGEPTGVGAGLSPKSRHIRWRTLSLISVFACIYRVFP